VDLTEKVDEVPKSPRSARLMVASGGSGLDEPLQTDAEKERRRIQKEDELLVLTIQRERQYNQAMLKSLQESGRDLSAALEERNQLEELEERKKRERLNYIETRRAEQVSLEEHAQEMERRRVEEATRLGIPPSLYRPLAGGPGGAGPSAAGLPVQPSGTHVPPTPGYRQSLPGAPPQAPWQPSPLGQRDAGAGGQRSSPVGLAASYPSSPTPGFMFAVDEIEQTEANQGYTPRSGVAESPGAAPGFYQGTDMIWRDVHGVPYVPPRSGYPAAYPGTGVYKQQPTYSGPPQQHPSFQGQPYGAPPPRVRPRRVWNTTEEIAERTMEQERMAGYSGPAGMAEHFAHLMYSQNQMMHHGGLYPGIGVGRDSAGDSTTKGIAKLALVREQAREAGFERWQSIARTMRKHTEQESDAVEDTTYRPPRLWTYFQQLHPHIRGQKEELWTVHLANEMLKALELPDQARSRDRLYGLLTSIVVHTDCKLYDGGKVDQARLMSLLNEPMVSYDSKVSNKKVSIIAENTYAPLCTPEQVIMVGDFRAAEEALRKQREKYMK